jgi:hypothetical protein
MSDKKRGPGRPAKEPADLITIDQAVIAIREELVKKYSPEVADRCALAKGTIRNKVWNKSLNSWKKGKYVLLSRSEVLKLVS